MMGIRDDNPRQSQLLRVFFCRQVYERTETFRIMKFYCVLKIYNKIYDNNIIMYRLIYRVQTRASNIVPPKIYRGLVNNPP